MGKKSEKNGTKEEDASEKRPHKTPVEACDGVQRIHTSIS